MNHGYRCYSILLFLSATLAIAQTPYTPDVGKVGLPENGTFSGGSIDTVQLNNGNLHIDIPLLHLPGIGMDTDLHLIYDNKVWNTQTGTYPQNTSGVWTVLRQSRPFWQGMHNLAGMLKWGWHPVQWECNENQYPYSPSSGTATMIDSMTFTDEDGTAHQFPISGYIQNSTTIIPPSACVLGQSATGGIPTDAYSEDTAAYHLVLNAAGQVVSLTDKHGTNYIFSTSVNTSNTAFPPSVPPSNVDPGNAGTAIPVATFMATVYISSVALTGVEDSNGNRLTCCSSVSWNSAATGITDTAGRTLGITYSTASQAGGANVDSASLPFQSISYLDQNGAERSITIGYGTVSLNLAEICNWQTCGPGPGTQATVGNATLPTSVVLQNGDTYSIAYVPNSLGEIQSITLPTGATISYTWGNLDWISFSGRTVTSRTVTVNGQESIWSFNYANYDAVGPMTVTVTDPNQNDTVYTCSQLTPYMGPYANVSPTCYMTGESIYSGSSTSGGAVVATKSTGYTQYGCSWSPTSEIFSWAQSGQTTETDSTFDTSSLSYSYNCPLAGQTISNLSRGNIKSKFVYDYGSGAHGALISNTQYSYLHESNSAYANANIADRISQVSLYNSATQNSSTLVAQSTTAYDIFSSGGQGSLSATNGTSQHDSTMYSTANSLRGLPTSVTKITGPGSSATTTYTNYNDLGRPTVTTDGRGYSTSYSYGPQNAFLASTTMPTTNSIVHVLRQQQDVNTGLLMNKTDQNSNQTSYTYDSRMRPLSESRPDGGLTTYLYPDPNHTLATVTEGPARSATTTVTLDGLGRKSSTSTTSDSICGPLTVDTTYDLQGRVQSVSNPHCSSALATDGTTIFTYDAIGRLVTKINPDQSSQAWSFNGSVIDFFDETGRHWQRTYDAEDRLTKVLEPDGSTTVSKTPTLETDYSYDALGDLLRVDQWGGPKGSAGDHVRQFAYDGVSRLLASNNPESASAANPAAQTCSGTSSGTYWSSCYAYDNDGNVTTKTDNRGISINYSYDALNRLTTKTYSDTTPPVTFTYDSSSVSASNPPNSPNLIGQLTQTKVTAGASTLAQTSLYQYDAMGRLQFQQQCTPANMTNCTATPYEVDLLYDLTGKPTSAIFPSNVGGNGQPLALAYSYDSTERLLTASSNWSDASTHPAFLFQAPPPNSSVPAYGPMGLQNASIGFTSSGGKTTATLARSYNNRGRVVNGIYASGSGAIGGSTSSGSISIFGTEGTVTKTNAYGAVTLSIPITNFGGTYQGDCQQVWVPEGGNNQYGYYETVCQTLPCTGSVSITIGSSPPVTAAVNWETGDANTPIAALAAALNVSGSPVTAVANANGTLTLTSTTTGVASNYSVTYSSTHNQ